MAIKLRTTLLFVKAFFFFSICFYNCDWSHLILAPVSQQEVARASSLFPPQLHDREGLPGKQEINLEAATSPS